MTIKGTKKSNSQEPIRVVILDTETTGLPVFNGFDKFFPPHFAWAYQKARVIELAYMVIEQGNVVAEVCELVNPLLGRPPAESLSMEPKAQEIHGITEVEIRKSKVTTTAMLDQLFHTLSGRCVLVGHNIAFDWHVLCAEALRVGHYALVNVLCTTETRCTMRENTQLCGLTTTTGRMKWPKLSELHHYLFDGGETADSVLQHGHGIAVGIKNLTVLPKRSTKEPRGHQTRAMRRRRGDSFLGEHSALGDVRATARCFVEVERRRGTRLLSCC